MWENTGHSTSQQYLLFNDKSMDCTGFSGGNKGKGYSLMGGLPGGYYAYWNNSCTGVHAELGMCLFVKDAVCIPVNVRPAGVDPFATYGFDVNGRFPTAGFSASFYC
ncbi:MAG: hypothetical protein ABIK28_12090 [Planctomycetota bacterium]